MWGEFLTKKECRNEDMQFIHEWLSASNERIAYTADGTFNDELNKIYKAKRWLMDNLKSGKAKLIDHKECVNAEREFKREFKDQNIKFNDSHILALAKVGNIKTLCTHDGRLRKFFENLIKGEVYETKKEDKAALLNSPPCR